eukprot:955589-Pelagomonas_calceolata.AAC.6
MSILKTHISWGEVSSSPNYLNILGRVGQGAARRGRRRAQQEAKEWLRVGRFLEMLHSASKGKHSKRLKYGSVEGAG